MFDENINLKLPLIIIVSLLVLGGGVFIGINSNKKEDIEVTNVNNQVKKEDTFLK